MPFHQVAAPAYFEVKNLSHRYGAKIALDDVSLDVQKAEILALLGPSGSGKSTLLGVIAGILKSNSGQIFLNGRNLLELPPESRGLGMVFQDYALWPHMTVAENVAFPLRNRRHPRREISARVDETLKRVGLTGFERRRPNELSGGQQQRVALARAVIAETELLLLDEPLSALDPATRTSVRGELAEILRKLGLTTIIVTHDREEAFDLADQIVVLIDGQIQQHSNAQQVYERPANLNVARFMRLNVLPIQMLNGSGYWLEINGKSGEGETHIAVAPERTWISNNDSGRQNVLPCKLVRAQYSGGEYRLQVRIGDAQGGWIIEARSKESPEGDSLFVYLPPEAIHVIPNSALPQKARPVEQSTASQKLRVFKEEIA